MSRKRKRREEEEKEAREALLSPDAFQERGVGWVGFLEKHLKLIVLGLSLALILIVGVEIVRSTGRSMASDQTAALLDAVEAYRGAVSLQVVLTSTSPALNEVRYERARSRFRELLKKDLPEGIEALVRLYEADLARRVSDLDAAVQGYDEYLERGQDVDALRFLALEGKGYALEEKGLLDEALAAFKQIEAMESYADYGLKHSARVLFKKGDLAGAKAAYQEIVAREPPSPLQAFAERQLAAID